MSTETGIGWTDSTFNPWMGCTAVSPACDHCYAQTLVEGRFKRAEWGPGKPRVRTSAANWKLPLQWEREHEAFFREHGRNRRVFCASLADVFDNEVPGEWRSDLFNLIADTPHLTWQLLTKRIGNAHKMLDAWAASDGNIGQRWTGFPNLWLGITVCNQQEADRDIPKLLAVPAAKRFLSIEPMLGAIDLERDSIVCSPCPRCADKPADPYTGAVENCRWCEWTGKSDEWAIDWVIAGGESGPHARPSHPDWFRSLRDQCASAGVPFFFKQWGEWIPESGMDRAMRMLDHGQFDCVHVKLDGSDHTNAPDDHRQWDASDVRMVRVGKALSGNLLDGVKHEEFPA